MILPYHFVQPRAGHDFSAFLARFRALATTGSMLCFDLEDSHLASTPALTRARKAAARHLLRALLTGPDAPAAAQTLIRLNAVGSADYLTDLRWLATVPTPGAVILPKVESSATIRRALRELPVAVGDVIATVETIAGLRATPALAALAAGPRFSKVALGHCDLNLAFGHFPFHHQQSPVYWQWVAQLDRYLAPAGKWLINSPLLHLADGATLAAVLARLQTFASAAGQITLSLQQTQWCAQPPPAGSLGRTPTREPTEYARTLLITAAAGTVTNSSLALTAERRVVAPQEVVAARLFLAASRVAA